MSGVLPANVSFFMQRLAGVSTSHFKIQPQGSDSATSNKIVRFELPSNTLVNMRNVRLMFNADADGTASAGGRLPNKIDSLISRVAVYMGGVLVQNNFNNYNVLRHAKDAIEGDKCPALHGHPEIVRATSYHDSSTYANDANEAYAGKDDMFCIDYWEGLLGSIEPSIIDTGLLPQITLELTLAEDAVCPSIDGVLFAKGDGTGITNSIDKAGGTACTYNLTNMSLQVEVLGMATSVLDQLVEARISQVGYLSLPFKNYYTFSSTHSGTSRFSVNSASWDRAWFVYRPTGAGTQPASFSTTPAGAHPVPGYKVQGFLGDDVAGQTAADIEIGIPTFDTGGVLDTNKEKYISKFFRMKEPLTSASTPATYQLQVNGASLPAYKCNRNEMYEITKGSVDGMRVDHNLTLAQYIDSYFVQCMRFCLPDSGFSRLASGLDTRSVSAQAALETSGLDNCHLDIFAETTAELRVGSGRSIEIIA